jgi:hypothetical protein
MATKPGSSYNINQLVKASPNSHPHWPSLHRRRFISALLSYLAVAAGQNRASLTESSDFYSFYRKTASANLAGAAPGHYVSFPQNVNRCHEYRTQ